MSLGKWAFGINWKPKEVPTKGSLTGVSAAPHKLRPSARSVARKEAGSTLAPPLAASALQVLGMDVR